jgi:HEAT repeat protein
VAVLSLLLAGAWLVFNGPARTGNARLDWLVGEVRAEVPRFYRWVNRTPAIQNVLPSKWATKLRQADLRVDLRRWRAVEELAGMGTNAWPAVPMLVDALQHTNRSIAVAAGSVLARIKADQHPDWRRFEQRLSGCSGLIPVFRYLEAGRLRNPQQRDFAHRRFVLIGLAAVGPAAESAIPDVMEIAKSKEDYELRVLAIVALARIGSEQKQCVALFRGILLDGDEWPEVRAAAVTALAAAVPKAAETRNLLHSMLHDERALVRLAAASSLWNLKMPASEVLPTLTALLSHKLISARIGALKAVADMGSAARPSRSEVERLMSDENESVRREAATALKSMN